MDPEYGRHYRELYEKHWWWRAREEMLSATLREHLKGRSALSILDVGCGDGLFFERLGELGEVEGVEPSANLVDPNGPHRPRITIAPFDERFQPGKRYDVILMLDVLEHLDEPREAVRHAVSLLKPEGSVFITVPAFRQLWTNHDRLNEHRTRFTKASLRSLAESAGMKVIEARYFFIWLFAAKLGVRVKERVLPSEPRTPSIPFSALNRFLYLLSVCEERLSRVFRPPFGSSLLVIGRRQAAGEASK